MTENLDYVVGFYYSDAHHHETSMQRSISICAPIAPAPVTTFAWLSKSEVKAGYGQATYDLSSLTGINGLKVTGGYRYTGDRSTMDLSQRSAYGVCGSPTESELFQDPSWQVGLDYQVAPELHALRRLARELAQRRLQWICSFQSNPAGLGGGNKFLPETTKDVEIGAKYRGKPLGYAPQALISPPIASGSMTSRRCHMSS